MGTKGITRVLMLGTDISTMGGISSVIKDYMSYGLMARLNADYMPTHKDGTKIKKIIFYLRQMPKILMRLPAYKIVHIHTSHGWSFRRLFILLLAAHLFGKKTVLHVHGSQFDSYYANASAWERWIIRYGLRTASVVIALSAAWREKLLEIEPSADPQVVLNAIDIGRFHFSDRQMHAPVRVLFLGRLGKRKGIYDILEAIGQLERAKFHFVLAGDGELEAVQKIVRDRGYQDCVEVPGWVGADRKAALLREADIYILPSYQEGLPISILEAMSAGLPVISTPVGGIPEAVVEGQNGYLVTPGDYHALAKCIEKIGMNADLWKELGNASYALAEERFGMAQVESELKIIYESLSG